MKNEGEHFKNGIFIFFRTKKWSASSGIKTTRLLRTNQSLVVNRKYVKGLHGVIVKTKRFLDNNTIPYPVMKHVFFIPEKNIQKVNKRLLENKIEFYDKLKLLLDNYGNIKRNYKKKFPEYYDETKYPEKKELKRKFCFEWYYYLLEIPTALTKENYLEEQKKNRRIRKIISNASMNRAANKIYPPIARLEKECRKGLINILTVRQINSFLQNEWEGLLGEHVENDTFIKSIKAISREMNRLYNSNNLTATGHKISGRIKKIMKRIKSIKEIKFKQSIK